MSDRAKNVGVARSTKQGKKQIERRGEGKGRGSWGKRQSSLF